VRLNLDRLSFSYGNSVILNKVSFGLKSGEFLAIIGPNGAGKSTLLKCINHILKPQNGSITIDGKNITEYERREIAKIIGYVPQNNGHIFPTSVFDTLLLGRKPYIQWSPTTKDLEVVSEVIQTLKLEPFAARDINELSGGEKQKVLIGRALVQKPSILLLDELTSNLDLKHQIEVLKLVKDQTTNNGLSAIMTIHDLNLVRYCDRILILNQGNIVAKGGLEVLTPDIIESVYQVKVQTIKCPGGIFVIPEELNSDMKT